MLSCLSCVRSVFYVLGGLVELEPREYNCGLRYLTVSCTWPSLHTQKQGEAWSIYHMAQPQGS